MSIHDHQGQLVGYSTKQGSCDPHNRLVVLLVAFKRLFGFDVQASQPNNLTATVGLTQLYEAKCHTQNQKATNVEATHLPDKHHVPYSSQNLFPGKRLTLDQLMERRDKGISFHCNEKFIPSNRCKGLFFSLKVVC